MTEETKTRAPRKKNPLVEYNKAKTFANRARKAAARAVDLADKARVAAEKADALAALKDDAEKDEAAALEALKAVIEDSGVDTEDEYDEADE